MSNIEKPYPDLEITLIKLELALRLHGDLREEEWEDLKNDHYVDKLLDSTLSCSEVADTIRRRRQIYGQSDMSQDSPARKLSKEDKEPESLSVLSLLVAEEAAQDMEVQAFRKKVLGGQYLPSHKVTNWLQAKAGEDGPATWWLKNLPISSDQIEYRAVTRKISGGVDQTHARVTYPFDVNLCKQRHVIFGMDSHPLPDLPRTWQ